MRRFLAVPAVVAVLGLVQSVAAASAAVLPPGCSQSGQIVHCTETFTSGSNPFTIPAGVSSIHVVAIGGEGGTTAFTAGVAGSGAEVTGDVAVMPGSTLYAVVGSNADGQTPGSNGGGAVTGSPGGAGGGASDVRAVADDLASRLIVAGGGGGAGGEGSAPFASPGAGGAAGGQPGVAASDPNLGGGGGGGASTSSGGAGGGGAGSLNCFSIPPDASTFCPFPAGSGSTGSAGAGGAGGAPGGFNVTNIAGSFTSPGGAGGGGGGGFLGGGGGGGGESGAGGGGGGSDLVPPGGSETVDTTGTPIVQISYSFVPQAITYQAPQATISAPAGGGTYALDQPIDTSFTCSESAGGPGVASCDDSNGMSTATGGTGHLNTTTLGQHTYTVTAASKDGLMGTASITYTVVAPKVSITTTRARYAHGRTKVRLACVGPAGGACSGTLTLTIRVKRTVHSHGRRVTVFTSVVLAESRYDAQTGSSAVVSLKFGHSARTLIADPRRRTVSVAASRTHTVSARASRIRTVSVRASRTRTVSVRASRTRTVSVRASRTRTVSVRANATVQGGATAARTITLVSARPPSPLGLTASVS